MADKVDDIAKKITGDEALLRASLADNNAQQAGYAAEKLRIDSGYYDGMGPALTPEEGKAVAAAVKAKDVGDKVDPLVDVNENGRIHFTEDAQSKILNFETRENIDDFGYGEFKAAWEGKGRTERDLNDRVQQDISSMGQLWSGGAQKLAQDFRSIENELGSPGSFGLGHAISDELARLRSPYRFKIHEGGHYGQNTVGSFNIIDIRTGKPVLRDNREF